MPAFPAYTEPTAEDRLTAWVKRSLERHPEALPVFPWVASKLLLLLERADVAVEQVEELACQDPVVSSQLLRAANSALLGGIVPVDRVAQAVIRLGFKETRDVALTAACRALFDVEDRAERKIFPELWQALWHDALLVAYGGRLLAAEIDHGDAERVFAGGLFRNVGGLLVLKTVAAGVVRGRIHEPSPAALAATIDDLHAELGATYVRSCGLPEHTVEFAARHHEAALPLTPELLDLHLVRVADGLSEALGVAPFACGEMSPSGAQSAAALGLHPERLAYFHLQFEALLEQIRTLA